VYRGQKILRNNIGKNSVKVYIIIYINYRYFLLRCQAATNNSKIFLFYFKGYAHGCLIIKKKGYNQNYYKIVYY